MAKYGLRLKTVKLAEFEKFMMTVSFDFLTLEEAEPNYDKGHFEVKEIELK